MNPILRVVLYVVLVLIAVVFGQRFFAVYSMKMEQAARRFDPVDSTNSPSASATDASTNSPPASATDAKTDVASAGAADAKPKAKPAALKPVPSHFGLYAAGTLAAVIVLGLMLAHDVSHYFAHRTHKALYNEEGEGIANPEYERAEQVWADGEHLEAIRLMREYLAKNPREQHVALRIAEIYEKDLLNPLAAALEYEDVLKNRLESERWGWAAIHLCNLYYHLNQEEKAQALLRRIITEHSGTGAAKKARERLGIPEDQEVGEVIASAEETAPDEPGAPKLPPGFRRKKT